MAKVIGLISVASSHKEHIKLFHQYKTVDDKMNALWDVTQQLNHILFYDYDDMCLSDVIENCELFKSVVWDKLKIDLDLFILQSSFDGFHVVNPVLRTFETINSLMGFFPDNVKDKKSYPNLKGRDYDKYATLRISPKYNNQWRELKGKPILKYMMLSESQQTENISLGHLNFFGLPLLSTYNPIKTFPVVVKYNTFHRVK